MKIKECMKKLKDRITGRKEDKKADEKEDRDQEMEDVIKRTEESLNGAAGTMIAQYIAREIVQNLIDAVITNNERKMHSIPMKRQQAFEKAKKNAKRKSK